MVLYYDMGNWNIRIGKDLRVLPQRIEAGKGEEEGNYFFLCFSIRFTICLCPVIKKSPIIILTTDK